MKRKLLYPKKLNLHRKYLTSKEFRQEREIVEKEVIDKLKAKEELKRKKIELAQRKKNEKIHIQVEKREVKELNKKQNSTQ